MSESKTYTGGCHCGKVRYEISTSLGGVAACNCSICSLRGWLLTFVAPEQFKLLKGEGELTDYQFGKKNVHHLFCKTCGTASFSHGKKPNGDGVYSINVRCLDGVDVNELPVKHYDGKHL